MSILQMNIRAFRSMRFHELPPVAVACVVVGAVGFTALPVSAQIFDDLDTSGFFARAGGMARFNVKATFSGIAPPTLPPGVYENGFVLPDIGGSPVKTWNWGYNSPDQIV